MEQDHLFFNLKDLKYLGKNVIIGRTVRIRKPHLVSIGDNTIIDDFTYISCELEVGNFCHIAPSCSLIGGGGKIKIGSFVNIASFSHIISASNDFKGGGLSGPGIPKEFADRSIIKNISIGDHALFGSHTVVLPGAIVPEGMATGAFSLVNEQKYESWKLYAGIPCRLIGNRDGKKIISQTNLLLKKWKKI